MQHFVDAKLDFDACYVYQDVNRAIRYVHLSGLVHRGILSDPNRYLFKNVCSYYFLSYLVFGGFGYMKWYPLCWLYNFRVNISGSAIKISEDAEGKGEKTILAHQLSILLCGWRDAIYVGGNLIHNKLFHSRF